MKKILKYLPLFASAAALIFLLASCEKEDVKEPLISYVRVTDPLVKDSLLAGAGQGQMVAIIGSNLGTAIEVWFNDQKAQLLPTLVSDNAILVNVPSNIPIEITNQLRVVFANGKILYHEFETQISAPEISYMLSEYVATGDTVSIRGNYFYDPITVTFAGGKQGKVVRINAEELAVEVPEGAMPGPINITTNFGTVQSNFWFRDNRNIVLSSDPFTGWWNSSFVVSNPGPGDPPLINGNYIRVTKKMSSWNWVEVAGGPATAMGDISKNIPDEAILKPELYNLKFEVNTIKPYNANVIKFNFGLISEYNDGYKWEPPIDTHGKWQTITIPFDEVAKGMGGNLQLSPTGYWTRILMGHAPGDLDADIAFDNFRIVPKEIK